MAKERALAELLSLLFVDARDLRRWLRQLPAGQALVDLLPGDPIGKSQFIDELLLRLVATGMANEAFFHQLESEIIFRERMADIRRVATLWCEPPSAGALPIRWVRPPTGGHAPREQADKPVGQVTSPAPAASPTNYPSSHQNNRAATATPSGMETPAQPTAAHPEPDSTEEPEGKLQTIWDYSPVILHAIVLGLAAHSLAEHPDGDRDLSLIFAITGAITLLIFSAVYFQVWNPTWARSGSSSSGWSLTRVARTLFGIFAVPCAWLPMGFITHSLQPSGQKGEDPSSPFFGWALVFLLLNLFRHFSPNDDEERAP